MSDLATNSLGGDDSSAPTGVENTPSSHQAMDPAEAFVAEATAQAQSEPETEEIDFNGEKHRIPKALKGAFLMQSDYTRKTQEIAERGRSLEERATALQHHGRLQEEHMAEVAQLAGLNDQVRALEHFDWASLHISDPIEAQALFQVYAQLRDNRDAAAGALHHSISQRALDGQRTSAKRIEEGHAAVAREIKDWNVDLFGKALDFAVRDFGFSPHEVAGVSDPRLLKILHRAYVGDQVLRKQAAGDKAAAAHNARPLTQVGSNTGANTRRTTDPSGDGLSTNEWMRRENDRVRKKPR